MLESYLVNVEYSSFCLTDTIRNFVDRGAIFEKRCKIGFRLFCSLGTCGIFCVWCKYKIILSVFSEWAPFVSIKGLPCGSGAVCIFFPTSCLKLHGSIVMLCKF